jgi:diguanylate cyclase (GGDEF)-like protein/PAS domain S-box-containing protein
VQLLSVFKKLSQWGRPLAQPVTYIGVLTLIITAIVLVQLTDRQKKSDYEDAVRHGANLSLLLERHVATTIKKADSTLLFLRALYQDDPAKFNLSRWVHDASLRSEITFQVGIVGADGFLKSTSFGPLKQPLYVGDLEPFRVHIDSNRDEVFIGKPVRLRTSGRWSIQLTRRISAPDGSFAGVITASLDPYLFIPVSLNLRRGGFATINGLDKTIRIRFFNGAVSEEYFGQSFERQEVFDLLEQASAGYFWNTPSSDDSGKRLIHYRAVDGFPLVVIIGQAEHAIFDVSLRILNTYYGIAGLLIVAIFGAIALGVVRERKLSEATAAMKRAQVETAESRDNLARAESMADLGHMKFVQDTGEYSWSDGTYRIMGKSPETFTPTLNSTLDLIHPDDRAALEQHRRNIMAGLNLTRPILRAVRDDGNVIYLEFWSAPLRTSDGAINGMFGTIQDVTKRKQTEEALSRANQELVEKQFAIDQSVIVAMTDLKGTITYANDRFCRISGYSREELLGQNHRILNSGTHRKSLFRDMYRQIANGQVWRGEICNKAKDGSLYWVDTTIAPQLGPDGKPVSYMSIRVDITARKLAESKISHMASHDPLTGLGNRAALNKKLDEALAHLRRHQGTFAILFLDLDGFKNVNDSLGHTAGDDLLKELADRLRSTLSDTDFLARLGGDEFAIIQAGVSNQREAAVSLAVRVLEAVAKPFNLAGHSVSVGTSIGIALVPENGTTSGDLLQKADIALYCVKAEGRNNFRFFDEEMGKDTAAQIQLLNELRTALARNEFELHYQPVFETKTLRLCGVEALVRWRHPVDGLISPDRFIPLAEKAGLMEPLGEWILEKVCNDAASWPSQIKVAINVSTVQFRTKTLFDVILCTLVESGLPPERLELEITETALMQNMEISSLIIRQLKNIGISIALDDFGTGDASLNYLTKLPIDKVKIDQSFTHGLGQTGRAAAIVASILTLARELDMTVTAEGVETNQQLDLLRAAGVHQVQGNLLARPRPATELDFSTLNREEQVVDVA